MSWSWLIVFFFYHYINNSNKPLYTVLCIILIIVLFVLLAIFVHDWTEWKPARIRFRGFFFCFLTWEKEPLIKSTSCTNFRHVRFIDTAHNLNSVLIEHTQIIVVDRVMFPSGYTCLYMYIIDVYGTLRTYNYNVWLSQWTVEKRLQKRDGADCGASGRVSDAPD